MLVLLGVNLIDVTFGRATVTLVVPVTLAELAVTVADPTPTALRRPDEVMVATEAGLLAQNKFAGVLELPSS